MIVIYWYDGRGCSLSMVSVERIDDQPLYRYLRVPVLSAQSIRNCRTLPDVNALGCSGVGIIDANGAVSLSPRVHRRRLRHLRGIRFKGIETNCGISEIHVHRLWLDLRWRGWCAGRWPWARHALGWRAAELDVSRLRCNQGRLWHDRNLIVTRALLLAPGEL